MNPKKSLIAFAIACNVFTHKAHAQNDTLYINDAGTVVSKENAIYYRIISPEKDSTFLVKDFYPDHKLYVAGHYTSTQAVIREGNFVYYDREGICTSEGNYKKGFKTGLWIYYFAGSKKVNEKCLYQFPGKGYYKIKYDSISGRVHTEGAFDAFDKKTGIWKEFHYFSDSVKTISNYELGVKQGEQLEFYKSGKLKRREIFEGYKLRNAVLYDEEGRKQRYFPAYEYPQPPENIKQYLSTRVKCFDAELKAQNIELRLKVLADGSISEIEILNNMHEECKSGILKALSQMKKWKPYKRENVAYDFVVERIVRYYSRGD